MLAEISEELKESRDFQKWSVTTIGCEYTSLVMDSARRELMRNFHSNYNQRLYAKEMRVVFAMRLYAAVSKLQKMDIRLVCQFFVDNRIMVKSFINKNYAYRSFNLAEKLGLIVHVGERINLRPRIYTFTKKGEMLFSDFDRIVKEYFESEFTLPSNRHWPKKYLGKKFQPKNKKENI